MKHFNFIGMTIMLGVGGLCHAGPSHAQSQAVVAREYQYGFGAGVAGALQQDDFPLEFEPGLRAFFNNLKNPEKSEWKSQLDSLY